MKTTDKLQYIQDNHFGEWLKTRQQVENELSDRQQMFCLCGRLATGLHESHCSKFRNKVTSETLKRLEHLLPRCEFKFGDEQCQAEGKHTESSGDGRLVRVCTPHRRLLNRQKKANNNV